MATREEGEPSYQRRAPSLLTAMRIYHQTAKLTPSSIYGALWFERVDRMFVQAVFDVAHMVPMDTPSNLERAITRIYFVLSNQPMHLRLTRLMVGDQYEESRTEKYFRKFGLPQYDELYYIFAVKAAHALPEGFFKSKPH